MSFSYFCTGGRGTEVFIAEELSRFDAQQVHITDGKVFFKTDASPAQLCQLKSVERIFACIKRDDNFCLRSYKDLKFLWKCVQPVIAWQEALKIWKLWNAYSSYPSEELDPAQKKIRLEPDPLTFRVSCKCSGRASQVANQQKLSRIFASEIFKQIKWKSDTSSPMVEVFVQLNHQGLVIGLPLTRRPLSDRSYLRCISLRSTIAWIIGSLAEIQPTDIVLDPMCGRGTILIESAHSWPACYIGCDSSESQLEKAIENMNHTKWSNPILFFTSDVLHLPFSSCFLDVIVCDIPFDLKHKVKGNIQSFHSGMLHEMNRILAPGGRVILLVSQAHKDGICHIACQELHPSSSKSAPCCSTKSNKEIEDVKLAPTDDSKVDVNITEEKRTSSMKWLLKRNSYVKLGETNAEILVFYKDNNLGT